MLYFFPPACDVLMLQELSGKLIIAPAEKNHSGAYVCVATNTVGVRESRAARLSVLGEKTHQKQPITVLTTLFNAMGCKTVVASTNKSAPRYHTVVVFLFSLLLQPSPCWY